MKTLFVSSAFLSYMASLGVHAFVLLGAGWTVLQEAEYGVKESSSAMQIDLVSASHAEMPNLSDASVSKSTFEKIPELDTQSEKSALSDVSDLATTELVKPEKARYRPSPAKAQAVSYSPSCSHGRDVANIKSDNGAIVRVNPQYLKNPPPQYPELARQKKQEGTVTLLIIVSSTGEPVDIQVENTSGYVVLDQAAKTAVSRWRFKPANVGGVRVISQVEVPVRFKLN